MGSTDSNVPAWSSRSTLLLAVLGAAQDRLAPADGNAAVDGAQPDSVDAGGAQRCDEALVHLAAVGHQHGVHGRRVGIAGDASAGGGDHARRHAEAATEVAELGVAAVDDHDWLDDGAEILGKVAVATLADGRATADLDDEHALTLLHRSVESHR